MVLLGPLLPALVPVSVPLLDSLLTPAVAFVPFAPVPTAAPAAVPAPLPSEGLLPLSVMPAFPPELGTTPPFRPAELVEPLTPPILVGPPLPAELVEPLTLCAAGAPIELLVAVPAWVAVPPPFVFKAAPLELAPLVGAALDEPEPRLRMTGCA